MTSPMDHRIIRILELRWLEFVKAVMKMNEDELARAIHLEKEGKKRRYYLVRLKERHNRLRLKRETKELFK